MLLPGGEIRYSFAGTAKIYFRRSRIDVSRYPQHQDLLNTFGVSDCTGSRICYLATDIYESEIDILSIPLHHLSLFHCYDLFSSICQKPWIIVAEGTQPMKMDPSNLPRYLYCCHNQEHKGYYCDSWIDCPDTSLNIPGLRNNCAREKIRYVWKCNIIILIP